jgi:hypothetical protein
VAGFGEVGGGGVAAVAAAEDGDLHGRPEAGRSHAVRAYTDIRASHAGRSIRAGSAWANLDLPPAGGRAEAVQLPLLRDHLVCAHQQ